MDSEALKNWSLRTDLTPEDRIIKEIAFVPHVEPNCGGQCGYQDPHRHGFSCHKSCPDCSAICHYLCPAHKEK